MNPPHSDPEPRDGVRARMPADVDAADRVLYGLTFRQLAILAAAALLIHRLWRTLDGLLPAPALLAIAAVAAACAFGLAVGRRDGLPLDVWLLAAVRHTQAPKALTASPAQPSPVPNWVDAPSKTRVPLPAPLRLPADAIDDDGQISLPTGVAAVVGATSVNLALRTPAEQAALTETFGRWLNSLSAPAQIVVSAQPVDLASHARALAEAAPGLPHPALEAAGADHAAFLADLAEHRDPLRRQILITVRASNAEHGGHAARRRAEETARALSGLGVTARVLDGAAVTAALAACADPYRPPRPGGLAAPDTVITGAPARTPNPRNTP